LNQRTLGTLMNAYARAGKHDNLPALLREMRASAVKIDLFSFNKLIRIYGRVPGQEAAARTVLSQMRNAKVQPDTQTFNLQISTNLRLV